MAANAAGEMAAERGRPRAYMCGIAKCGATGGGSRDGPPTNEATAAPLSTACVVGAADTYDPLPACPGPHVGA